jgi:hypothetical protein
VNTAGNGRTPNSIVYGKLSDIRRKSMPKCGVCGWSFSERTLTKHAETPCGEGDSKAEARPYAPEIDDLIKIEEESK